MSRRVNVYDMLKVPRGCARSELKKAYHAMARKIHPDKNPDDPQAAQKFMTLKRAYEVRERGAGIAQRTGGQRQRAVGGRDPVARRFCLHRLEQSSCRAPLQP